MAFCLAERLAARNRVAVAIGLSRALDYRIGVRVGLALGVLHCFGRRLVMKLRRHRLRCRRTAFRAG